jgi:uridine kinase
VPAAGRKPEGHTIEVLLNGTSVQADGGISVARLLEQYPHPGRHDPLGVVVNGRLRSLDHSLVSNCRVDTVDYASKDGASIYRRTATLILCEAAREIDPQLNPTVGQALAGGYIFSLRRNGNVFPSIDPELVKQLKKGMLRIVEQDRPVTVRRVAVEEALNYFRSVGAWDKVKLLETTRRAEIQWGSVGEFRDLIVGPLAVSTGRIKRFDLVPYASAMVLRFPAPDMQMRSMPQTQSKLYDAYLETRTWNDELEVSNVGQLNEAVIKGHISEVIQIAEGFQERKIVAIADEIQRRQPQARLVLVAGPSASGKTTFTKRLGVQLRVLGLRPVSLSMDNYYVNRVDTPKNADGTYNFECLEALDLDLFNDHVLRLVRGEEVATPRYSFPRGERTSETMPMKLLSGDILIVEGIHCLNERLTVGVPREQKFKIYVSALTQLSIDDHSRIFTSDVRLLRRIVRDRLFRNYGAADTLRQWPSVRAGEDRYIFPFQEEADVMFNSALVFEPAVLRIYAERFLLEVQIGEAIMSEAYRLLKFLHLLVPLFPEEVPQNSLLREFIGGSAFHY